VLVPGLEDLAGPAAAEALQQHIGPQRQLGAAPLEQLVGLERSQPVAPEQFARQAARVGKAPELVFLFLQLCCWEQPVSPQGVPQLRGGGRNGTGGSRRGGLAREARERGVRRERAGHRPYRLGFAGQLLGKLGVDLREDRFELRLLPGEAAGILGVAGAVAPAVPDPVLLANQVRR